MSAGPVARIRAALARASAHTSAHTSDRRLLVALFAVGFVVRVAYVLQISGTEWGRVLVGDAVAYDAWARAIAAGDWVGHEVFYQAPLYPYVLAVVYTIAGPSALAVRLVQAALGGVSCVLLAAAGRRFFSREVGLVAGLVLAFYGPAIFFAGLVHKMALDLLLTTAVLYALARLDEDARPRWAALAGVCLGCLALTRENALAWLPVLAIWLTWWPRGSKRVLGTFLAAAALVLVPVAARNAALGGAPLPTTSQAGVNFYLGNNADADGTYAPLVFGHGSFAQERADAIEIAQRAAPGGPPLTPAQVSRYWSSRAWSWIAAHPGDFLALLGRKWMLVWSAHEIPDSDEPAVYRDASFVLRATWGLSFGLLVPLAVVGAAADWPERRRWALLALLLLVSAASTAVFVVFARYRVAMIPLLVLFAVAGAGKLLGALRERGAARAVGAPPVLVLMALGVLAGVAVCFPRVGEAHPRAKAYYNLAVTLEAADEGARALAQYRAAVADDPGLVEAHVNLGALLARSGDLAGAVVEESEAVRLKPGDATAQTDLANALLQSGHPDEAARHYGEALRVDPTFAPALDGVDLLRRLKAEGF
jgi:4-amino-4-deoxy-L-arabinose transferase-like glycosyltransferase